MSHTANRIATADRADFIDAERAYLVAGCEENGLEVSIEPAGADLAGEMIFVGYGEGVASWIVHRADGILWLCRIEDRAGQVCEGSKVAVESVEEALASIIVDTEM